MPDKIPFLEMFPCCEGLGAMCGGLDAATVTSAVVNRETLCMELDVCFARMPATAETMAVAERITAEFGLSDVKIRPDWPHGKKSAAETKGVGRALLGRTIKGTPVPMGSVSLESGDVTVRGQVFEQKSRALQKRGAALVSFSLTDFTGSVRVSKFLRGGEDQSLLNAIKTGDWLTVQGEIVFNRYDGDMTLEPKSIALEPPRRREDTAAEKRVELHLHTRYSALDALADPAETVRQAAAWGHRAVAFTDHGVVQAFPEAWKAGKEHGVQVIYGMEGYFVNDVDDEPVINRASALPLDTEIVAFDLETTGLSAHDDRMTEIGAVIFSGGEIKATFHTFVNPERPIPPEITKLTGITDRDVFDAPDEAAALRAFLDFAGDRPLAAHNAEFDMSFLFAAADRAGLPYDPVYVDTLSLSRILLPDLSRHKLDIVARRLELPAFEHHRASDDAGVVARILEKFIPTLQARGAASLADMGRVAQTLRGGTESRRTRHITLLVQNKTGLKNLYELVTRSHLEYFKRSPIIPKSLLMQYREGLLVGSACESGEIMSGLVRGRNEAALRRLASFYDYLEIMPVCNNRFLVAEGRVTDDEGLRDLNRRVLALGDELGIPVAATGDAHYLEPEQELYRRILLASRKFPDVDRELPLYFKTTDEMLDEFSYLGEADCHRVVIEAPDAITARCEAIDLFPKELFTPTVENSAEDLQRLVSERMRELYGDEPPALVQERVETELRDILDRHYDVIYMSAQKLVARSLESGYIVGSRGSVGSSLVAFLAGITEVNALPAHYRCVHCRYVDFESGHGYGCGVDMPGKDCPICGELLQKDGFDIPFETFLGFGGDKVPDIDLNFSGEYQARAHKHTEELFGRDNVFRAGTISTFKDKTAFGIVKKYLEERGLAVTKAEESRLSLGCVGVKRTTGQHPGGLVIIPQGMAVTDFCPVQHPADKEDADTIITHFDYHRMEDNLLKLDILGHDDPTMLRMLGDMTGVDVRAVPLDDPDTMAIFKSPASLGLPEDDPIIGQTGTIGVSEFGTPFTRQMLVDTLPDRFNTLLRLSGFAHGTDVWAGNIRELILSGVANIDQTIGCRDDIMLYLIEKGMDERGAFKIMESVRKGRGLTDEQEREMRGLRVPDWYIESCQKIKYLFPRAHAVAYVVMAFRIAWFKVHEPLAYYSAYFYRRSQKDSFEADSMIMGLDAARRRIKKIRDNPSSTQKEEDLLVTLEAVYEFYLRGFAFEGIDLYKSDGTRFLAENGRLRPPFVAISGLGAAAAQDLVAARDSGRAFISMEDLSGVCPKVSQTHLEQLKALGALGDMPEESQISLF